MRGKVFTGKLHIQNLQVIILLFLYLFSVAHQMGMLSRSIGKEPNRQLTVRHAPSQHRPLVELLNQLIESKGSDPLFSLISIIPPTD